MHSSEHGPWVVVYKIDYFVLETLLSFLVFTPIQEFVLLSNSKGFKFITLELDSKSSTA